MRVTKLEKNEDGTNSFSVVVSQEEAEFLINYALDVLVDKGYVNFTQEDTDKVSMEILKGMKDEDFYRE